MLVGASTHVQRDSLSIIIIILQGFGQVCLIGVSLLLLSYSSTVLYSSSGQLEVFVIEGSDSGPSRSTEAYCAS